MNPYEVLQVAPGASRDELRRAWRRRALETHPDHGGDDVSFSLAQQAFARLSTPVIGENGPAPVLVPRMDAAALALRWYRRRRDRVIRPRVV
ncbi:hypothetical protein BH24ACT1_BH24ACT1_07180 [soil metagenome]